MRFRSCLAWLCLSLALAAATPGSLRYGAIPAGSGSRPVLIFIHGWNSDASTWSGSNDMEADATGAGYRTAFLDVYPDRSMWDNGVLVATAVDQVRARFPGAGVVLVCHSKGGVDAQTALVYDGAAPKVQRLITLGTPHWGTPLADLAWSSWAGWLADLVGVKNDGNRVLQTGYMAAYRARTDALPAAHAVPIYTAGGTKAGPWFSMYWFGGMAIGRTSDGVVPLDSSSLPYQQGRLFTRAWNHGELMQGHNAWPYLQATLAQPALPAAAAPVLRAPAEPVLPLDRLYRGGRTQGGMAEATFPVEAGQPLLQVLLETGAAPRRALLISPSGRIHVFRPAFHPPLHRDVRGRDGAGLGEPVEGEDGAFPGAVARQLTLPDPEPGLWRLQLSAENEDAYFLTALFPGDRHTPMPLGQARALARGRLLPLVAGASAPAVAVHTVRIAPPVAPMRAGAPGPEPVVLNRTLALTWPDGRERDVIFSEAE